jgi:hypothetical protein
MEHETMMKAIRLRDEIKELDCILFYLERTWRAKLTSKTQKLFLGNVAYGALESHEIECDPELTKRIRELVSTYKAEKEQEYKAL